jgi:formylglycine-generating enzyme required for sulfatase activity
MRADSTTYYYDGIDDVPTDFVNNPRMAALGRFAGNGGIVDNGDGTKTTNGVASVGSYRPNAFGLYDMIGNVRETVRDQGKHFGWSEAQAPNPYNTPQWNATMGIFGNSWKLDGTLWPQSAVTINLDGQNKYPDIGVRLAFFEGENPFKPAE